MKDRKVNLVLSAIELARLGEELEAAREELRRLVENGAPYESEEMKNALLKYRSLELRWRALETAYLEEKKSLLE